MIQRSLGKDGPVVSVVGMGTMSWPGCRYGRLNPEPADADPNDAITMIRAALDAGITLFDTAEGYGRGLAERHLGIALREAGSPDHVTVVTKTGPLFAEEKTGARTCNLSREHLFARVDGCLRRLGTECLDVLLAHWPDPATPVEETMSAISDLRRDGKIRHFGVSNFPNDLLARALECGPVVCNQLPCSLADRSIEDGRRTFCLRNEVGIMAYSPIGKGVLSGKYDSVRLPSDYRLERPHFRENLDRNLRIAARVEALANELAAPPVAVALAWTLTLPGITTAIPGAKSAAQISDHVAAAGLLNDPATAGQIAGLGADPQGL